MCAGWAIAGRSVLLVCRRLWSRSSRGPAAGIWVGEDELELAAGGQSVSAALTWIGGERGELIAGGGRSRPSTVSTSALLDRASDRGELTETIGAALRMQRAPMRCRSNRSNRSTRVPCTHGSPQAPSPRCRAAHSGIAVACEAPHRCRRRGGPPTAATSAKPPWLRLDEKLATPEPTTHDLNRRASREWIYITLRDATVSYPRPLTLDAVVDGGWNDRDGN